jgi:hypothetical protein
MITITGARVRGVEVKKIEGDVRLRSRSKVLVRHGSCRHTMASFAWRAAEPGAPQGPVFVRLDGANAENVLGPEKIPGNQSPSWCNDE